mmetsp:Transcript_19361/g.25222  ORF Transcript_19361/g.25222 Transcript_19361/m.25222 type:complete len:335 (-) Transcript_19361:18-1022(-)
MVELQSKTPIWVSLMKEACELFDMEQRYGEVVFLCDEILKHKPDHIRSKILSATAHAELGEDDTALLLLNRAIEELPDKVDLILHCCRLLKRFRKDDSRLISMYARVVELTPSNVHARYCLAKVYRRRSKFQECIICCDQLLAYDPNHERAKYLKFSSLVALGKDEEIKNLKVLKAPEEYVKKLYDSYAEKFDEHIKLLSYATPTLLAELLQKVPLVQNALKEKVTIWDNGLDLGCGTGLSGVPFAQLINNFYGVDLSQKMLDQAVTRGIYKTLTCCDAFDFLKSSSECYDVIISCDVFVYVGALSNITKEIFRVLKPGGIFALSCEALERVER